MVPGLLHRDAPGRTGAQSAGQPASAGGCDPDVGDPDVGDPDAGGLVESDRVAHILGAGEAGVPWVTAQRPGAAQLAREVLSLPALLLRERAMLWAGLHRELRARFGTTALGWAWPLLRPLALVAAYAVLFTQILGVRLPEAALAPGEEAAFGVYLVTGVLAWASISEGLSRATLAVTDHGGLVKRMSFPPEVLPLQAVSSELLFLGFGAAAFLACTGLLHLFGLPGGWPFPGTALLWLPLVAAAQLALVFGLALGLSALQVVLRDTQHAVGVGLTLLMFATPVFWLPSVEALPGIEPWLPWIEANPFHHLLSAWRSVLMGARPAGLFTTSIASSLTYVFALGAAAMALGAGLFRYLRPDFADEV